MCTSCDYFSNFFPSFLLRSTYKFFNYKIVFRIY